MLDYDRFISLVSPEPNTGCWIWLGPLNAKGYGLTHLRIGRSEKAHRASYEIHTGLIPDGYVLHHLCGVRCCVNPAHLRAVTNTENVRCGQAGKYQTRRTHCPRGHLYDKANTRHYKNERHCRACHVITTSAHRRRRAHLLNSKKEH